MKSVMLFLIPALVLGALAYLGFTLYHATQAQDVSQNPVVAD